MCCREETGCAWRIILHMLNMKAGNVMKLFVDDVPFLKANFHLHTTCSDGAAAPEEAMRLYREAGYDVLAITDHRKVTLVDHAPDGLLMIPGIELDYLNSCMATHILGLNVTPEVPERWDRQGTAQQGIDLIRACGGEAVLAHPAWSLNTPAYMASLEGLIGTEIWNSVSTVPVNPNRADSSSLIDVMCTSYDRMLPVFANDDTHRYGAELAAAATMVQAAEKTPEAVMQSLREGRFYATQGPAFRQVSYEDGVVRVVCSPVDTVMFYSNLPWAAGRVVMGQGLTCAEYPIHRNERYVRVQLLDENGSSAWCAPFRV